MICPGCNQRVEPVKSFENSPKTGKQWVITRCPRERCGFNLDIESYDAYLGSRAGSEDPRRDIRGDDSARRFGV